MSGALALYRLADELTLAVGGDRAAVAQLDREYGAARVEPAGPGAIDAAVTVTFGPLPHAASLRGRHKTVGWEVALSDPEEEQLTAGIAVRGRPRAFARSLVQGYFVEPLVSVAAARRGRVLLPGAAVAQDGGALLLVGRSGAGKSTVMARAAAAGSAVLGDDQVLVSASDGCRPFPRRMRFYADLRSTAPGAFRRLGLRSRAALRVRGVVATATGGYVAPSLPVALDRIGRVPPLAPVPLARVVVVERSRETATIAETDLTAEAAAAACAPVLREQRSRLADAGGRWSASLERVAEAEAANLREAFAGVPCARILVPEALPAPEAVAALARHLGVDATITPR